jgi:DNA-binding IclR family transcriptional regulator
MRQSYARPQDNVGSVGKALAILSAFTRSEPRITLRQLARKTGLSEPTIYRTAGELIRAGFLGRGDDGRFRLGPMLLSLGDIYRQSFDLGEIIEPAMARIVEETGESVNFYVRDGDARVCLYRHDAPDVWHNVRVGARLPLDRGAAGRVLLAFAGAEGEIYDTIRTTGVRLSIGDRDPFGAGASVPIFGPEGKLVGALTVHGHRARVEHKVATVFREVALRYGEEITRQLGGKWPFPVSAERE